MALPPIVTQDEWLAARRDLLDREKEQVQARDRLNADRRRLPMTRVEKDYRFQGPGGEVGLADLFDGRQQLIVQHVMFDPSWDDACPSCTADVDEMSDGLLRHLNARRTSFAAVSRAPYAKLADYATRRGWSITWVSSEGSDFNYDFHVTIDASKAPVQFNYRSPDELGAHGLGWLMDGSSEQPGVSCFLRDGDDIFHTYSTFARGTEYLGSGYALLDLTALGRQEDWEEPKDRAENAHGPTPDFA